MKRKTLSLALALIMGLGLMTISAAATIGATEVTWCFDASTGTLTFSGTGEMEDFNVPCGNVLPWIAHKQDVRSVVIEDGITSVGACSFYYFPNLSSVSIPGSVEYINWSAFEGCTSLRSVVLPEGVTSVGNWSFQHCTNLTDVSIPSTLTYANFTSFGDTPWMAAQGDYPTANGVLLEYQGSGREIVIPEGVTSVNTLHSDSVTHVTIPASVTEIVDFAFERCPSLTEITVAPGNRVYASRDGVLFSKDQTTLISYPAGRMGAYPIPAGVTEIAKSAFSSCEGLTGVTIPDSVQTIGEFAFCGTSLSTLTVPGSVTSIGKNAFSHCERLTSAVLEPGVTYTGDYGFSDCTSLSNVTLPDTLTGIGYCAFWGCTALEHMDVPNSVIYIRQYAFNITTEAPIPGLTLYGTAGSCAESFAKESGIPFKADLTPVQIQSPEQESTTPSGKIKTASPTNDKLTVNGEPGNATVYKINDSNYFKIRDVAALLNGTEKQFAVGYDGALNSVTATTGQGYDKQSGDLAGAAAGGEEAAVSNDAIYVDGEKVEAEVYKINGSNYFKLRDLGKALNFYVGWSAERGMYIESDKPYSE